MEFAEVLTRIVCAHEELTVDECVQSAKEVMLAVATYEATRKKTAIMAEDGGTDPRLLNLSRKLGDLELLVDQKNYEQPKPLEELERLRAEIKEVRCALVDVRLDIEKRSGLFAAD